MELLRLLQHARMCDGFAACETCRMIDLRLGDWPHVTEDPALRLEKIDDALKACEDQAERLYGVLEGSPMPSSVRSAAAQLVRWLGKTRELVVLPVTRGDDVKVRKVVRTAVVLKLVST